MVLIADNDKLNFNTAALATGPNGRAARSRASPRRTSRPCTGAALTRNQVVIGQIIGVLNYDIGHLARGNSGGGVAQLNAVGNNGVRAAAASLEHGSVGATCNQLQALQNEVDAQAGDSLTPAQAAELTTRIGWIATALGC